MSENEIKQSYTYPIFFNYSENSWNILKHILIDEIVMILTK